MYGRKGILAVLILWHLGLSYAQDINSCIDGFTSTGFSINDVETNKDIFSFPIKASQINIDSFTIASDTEAESAELATYFSLVLDDNALVLKSTDNLLNIDRFIQEPQSRTYYLVTGSIALTCDGASISQTIYISIYDTNNNAPIFNDDSPEFSVPMPIMPGVDISKYFSIEASDLDFTLINSNIIFTTDHGSDFETTSTTVGNKRFSPSLTALRTVHYTGDEVITLTATDTGNPSNSKTVQIKITANEDDSLDVPSFTRSYYTYQYTISDNDDESPVLTPVGEEITIVTNKPDSVIGEIEGAGDYNHLFKITTLGDKLSLSLTDKLPSDAPPSFTITVKFETDYSAYTAVIINVPHSLSFDKPYYSGTYSKPDNSLDIEDFTITTALKPDTPLPVTVEAAYDNYFKVTCRADNKCSLSILNPPSDIPDLDGSQIVFTITAQQGDLTDTSVVTIEVPQTTYTLTFDKPYYSGTYSKVDDNLEIEDFTLTTTLEDETPLSVVVEADYAGYFAVSCNNDNKCKLSITNPPLDIPDLEGSQVLFTITAQQGDLTDTSVVSIEVSQTTYTLTFDKPYYSGTYSKIDDNLEIEDFTLTTTLEDETPLSVVVEADYAGYFAVSCSDDNKCKLSITNPPLDIPDLDGSQVLFTITAQQGDLIDTSVVSIEVSQTTYTLTFDKPYYSGTYSKIDGNLEIEDFTLTTTLEDETPLSVVVEADYAGYFAVSCSNDNKCKLSITNPPLDIPDLDGSQVVFTITAQQGDLTATSVVAIEVEEETDVPKFSHSLYSFSYSGDSLELTPTDGHKIEITSNKLTDASQLSLDAGPDFNSYFNVPELLNGNEVSISLLTSLPSDSPHVLNVTLSCETDIKTETALVITLPVDTLSFDSTFYYGTYDKDTKTLLIDPFTVVTTLQGPVTVTPEDDYQDKFQVDCDESHQCVLSLIELDVTNIESHEIVFNIEAVVGDQKDNSVVVIDIQSNEDLDVPKFSSSLYSFNYSVDNNGNGDLVPTDNLVITVQSKKLNEIEITLDAGEYSSLFNDPRINNNEITISLKDTFPENAPSLLTAILSCETDYKVATAIIISIPHENAVLKFDKLFYSGTYDRDESSLTIIDPIAVITELDGELSVTPDNEYADMFNIDCEQESHVCTLSVQNLDVSDLDNHEIVFTITGRIDDIEDSSVVVIDIQSNEDLDVPKFSSSLYSFNYSVDNNGNGDLVPTDNLVITVESKKLNEMEITLDAGEYSSFFNVPGINNNEITISLKDTFPENTPSLLTATLSCKTDYIVATAIVISIPHENAVLKFDKLFYSGTYDRDEDSLTVESITIITELVGPLEVTVDNEYASKFKIECDDNTHVCKLSVQNLDVSDLEKNEIVFTITGRIEDIEDTEASSVVIIDIHLDEQLDVPSFESSSYRFDYKYDGEAPELEPTDGLVITIKTDKDEDKITLILDAGDLTTYFNQPQLNDKTITITLAKELPEDAPSLVTATLSCTTDYTADSAIIISLPKENADLKFDKLFYSGTYDKDKESLITIDPITVITTLQGELVVTPDDDYSNKFTIECPANVCAISEVNLDESDLEKSELVFTITARVGSVEDSAVVIIDIQPNESLDVPSFESSLYRFSYNRSDEETALLPSDDVEITIITTKINKVTLSLDAGDYNSSFDLPQLNDNTVTISLKSSGLPADTPSLLTLTLVCETDYKTETAIIIEVAQGNVKFDQPFYSGTYDKDTEGFTFDTIIVNTDLTEDLTVTLDDDYRTKFGVECTGRECSLSVVSLEQSDLENSEIVFTIKASIGEHEDTSVVVINIHETLDLPTFSSSSYSFIYSIDGEENPDLTPSDGLVITIDTTKPEKATVSLDEGDYKDYFKDPPLLSDNIVTLQLKEPFPEDIPDDFITVTLTCETDYATSAAILIQISKDTSAFRFSKRLYLGTYIVKEEAFSVEDIKVKTILSGDLEVVPESPYNDNFKVECDQGTRICKMSISDLNGLDLNGNLKFELNANIGDDKARSMVVITFLQEAIDVPSFGSGLYRFNYSDQDEANPTLIPTDGLEITVVTDKLSDDISFTFEGDYKSIFGDPQLIGEKVKLNLIDTLPEEAPSVITINLSFETDYIAKTTLEITVPNEEKLTFDKKFYVGVYDSNSQALVSIDSIKISSDISGALSVRPDSGFEDKIEIVCDTNKNCQLTVISLEDSDLENEQLEFNIIAKIDTFETTSAVSISILKSFEFSEISYSAKYSVDSNGEGTLSEDLLIDILHSENPGSLSITLAKYSEYFTFEYTTSESKYKLSKLDNIPVALLTTNTELVTEITASEDDKTTKAVLKIQLTELTAQKFDSNYYRAEYKINENQDLATVSLEDSVTFAVGNPADINIEFENKYKNNFEFNFESNTWVINVKQNLNADDMSYTHIVISLTSKNKDYSFLTDSAALVLRLPVTSAEDYPVFSEILYTAEYSIEGAIHTLSDTKIKAHNKDGTKLEVSLVSDGMYSDYFTIDQDGDYYKLSVKTNLDDDIINEEISITLVVEATVGGLTAQAPVVINLPLKRANSDLAFEKVLYSGSIDKKGNLEIKDNIKITTDIDDGDVIVSLSSSDYKKYFVASYKDKKLSIAYSDTEIPEETLKKVNVIPLELTASVKGTSVQASAVINIAVEHSTDGDDGDDDDDDGHPTNYTGYIAAISVLTVLLVGFLVGSIVLWYLKFRPRKFMTLDEDSVSSFEAKNSRFEKNPKLSEPIPAPIETRRPTGFSFSSPLELRDDDFAQPVQYLEPIEPPEEVVVETSPYENVEKEKPKSVAFDDVVEEMQIDAKDESENEEEEEEEERYINLDPKVEDQEAEPEKEDNVSRL